ncbi:receptor-type tyrosine-protein phosphatase C-like isoform X2 [Neocloeon triangulifer]|uniref:receptor-type tyrosine-protein phosphatase C-like isoform X2 n=1 Tax=Neocloeon triangulifer TaxID=2078957 RepID=UPI00286ECFAC|nr:receptor-type tyrosine-protein phosphatase C-like isoform X2 [Neocloeon triangulifer]
MMKLGKIIFLLVFFTCGMKNGAQGYLIAVKKGYYVEACLTDEFVGSDKDLLDFNGNPLILAGHDCNLVVENGCESWNIEGTYLTPNIQNGYDLYPPVDDFRLIDIPNFTNNQGKLKRAASFNSSEDVRLLFSVLASSSAQFLVSKSEKHDEGYIIVLDGWGDLHRSSIRYCKPFPLTRYSCEEKKSIDNNPILKNGNEWIPVTLEYQKTQKMVSVNVGNLTSFLQAEITQKDYLIVKAKNNEYAVTLNIAAGIYRGKGKLKFHQYEVLMPRQKFSKIRTSVKNIRGNLPICVDVIFWLFSDEKLIRNKEVFSMTVSRQKSSIFIGNGKFNGKKNEWKKERFTSENRIQNGDVIELTFLDTELTIGGIRFCAKDTKGDLIIKPKQRIQSCDIYSHMGTPKSREGSHKKLVEVTSNNKICQNIGLVSCVGLKACDSNEECACFPSFSGHFCENGCAAKTYGWNCTLKSDKSCEGDEINYNGSCSRGCLPGYRRLDCLDRIRQINPELSAIDIGPTKISLDMWKLTKNDSSFSRIAIQIKRNKSESWHTSVDYKNPLAQFVSIDGLKKNTAYNLRLVLYDMDGQFNDKNLKDIQFTTKLCQPIDNRSVEVKVDQPFSILIRYVADNETLQDFCKLARLDILDSENQLVFEEDIIDTPLIRNFNEYSCHTKYSIIVYGEDMSSVGFQFQPCSQRSIGGLLCRPWLTIILAIFIPTIGVLLAAAGTKLFCKNRVKKFSSAPVTMQELLRETQEYLEIQPELQTPNDETETIPDSAVKVMELEKYIETAISSGLLKQQFQHQLNGQTQSWSVGADPANEKKNRKLNVAAYDLTRVILKELPGEQNSDYINANFIDGYQHSKAYIATQGPLEHTVDDFWRMIWQEKVTQIVMVTNLEEDGKIMCSKYWPDAGQEVNCGIVCVRNLDEEIHADYIVRSMYISVSQESKLVQHLQFTSWPLNDVPSYPQTVSAFVEKIKQFKSRGPITVHCGAGDGRTGTIILIHSCLRMACKYGFIDVFKLFRQMRSQRAYLVESLEQYEFVHFVLLEAITIPKFQIPCSAFALEHENLLDQNKRKMTLVFDRLSKICDKDWQRAEKESAKYNDKSKNPIASSSSIVPLFPLGRFSEMDAVFVDGYKRKNQFISTQLPVENTLADFWQMIIQHNVDQIIVLTESKSSNVVFFPSLKRKFVYDNLQIMSVMEQETEFGNEHSFRILVEDKVKRLLKMTILHGWKKGNVTGPGAEALLKLWEQKMSNAIMRTTAVVCQDGVTESGLFLGIGILVEKMKLEQQVDVAFAMRCLRKSRPAFLALFDQFEMLFEAAKVYLQLFDTYKNFND